MSKKVGNKKENLNKDLYLFATISIVFFVYFFSLFRPWQPFDERLLYNETLFPIPVTISEMPEVIKAFVVNYHMESMNSFFSNFMTIRSNPIAEILVVIVSFLFKKNALLYHLLQIIIHMINTALVWIILSKIANIRAGVKPAPILISIFTLIWALHSANTEAILLVTNWKTIMTYTFCLLFVLFELKKITDVGAGLKPAPTSISTSVSTAILFCLTMFTTEYGYSLPLIIFFLAFGFVYKKFDSARKTFLIALNISLPYFIGLFSYFLLSLLRTVPPSVNLTSINSAYFFIERNLWLTPQIFLHMLKILFFPRSLSTYQSNLTELGNTLFDPYSVFCTCFYFAFLTVPVVLFVINRKKSFAFVFPLIYAFYFALFPNLHVLLPTYCLTADRYAYLPSILLIFLFFNLALLFLNSKNSKLIILICICILACLTFRTAIRIHEWNNPITLYKSAIRLDKNPLYKGQKLIVFADYVGALGNRTLFENSLRESLNLLNIALKENENKIKKYPNQSITLKIYGLDFESLLLKTAYAITTIKNDNLQEGPDKTLAFYEPYIKDKLNLAGINQIVLYAEILLKANQTEKAEAVLEYGLKKFPYSADLLSMLSDLYLTYKKDLNKGYDILQKAYNFFPNQQRFLHKIYKYYEETNDLENQAKFAYLIGLRDHSKEAYEKAARIYQSLNKKDLAQKAINQGAKLQLKQNEKKY